MEDIQSIFNVVVTILFTFLGVIWKTNNYLNAIIKVIMLLGAFVGAVLTMHQYGAF